MNRRRTMGPLAAWAGLVSCLAASTSLQAQAQAQEPARGEVVFRAARDEMARTMTALSIDKAPRPYFVAYTITDHESASASASFGSLLGSHQGRGRTLSVEVRVGDYAFDNTNFFSMSALSLAGMRTIIGLNELPLDDDYLEIRRQIWLATDAAFKQAVEAIAGKRAALLNHTQSDSLADFSRAEVTHTTDELTPSSLDLAMGESLVRELSRAGVSPGVYSSSVSLSAGNTRTYYLNSEGTTFVRSRPMVTLMASAATQSADGMPLNSEIRIAVRSVEALPGRDQLATRVRSLYATLDTVRNATVIDRYNGPVLFEGAAAAQLFSEQFAPALAASRKTVSSNPAMDRVMSMLGRSPAGGGTSLAEKLGARVLPAFLSVVDDPTIARRGSLALLGGYTVDDQGVPAHATQVIDHGILKTFLSGRTPVAGVAQSTGNYRGGMVAPSNLIVESTEGVPDAALRERLLSLAKVRGLPFAIVVRSLGANAGADDPAAMVQEMMAAAMGGGTPKGRNIFRAYKLYADGHEECVRGAQIVGMGVDAFKEIVATSSSTTVLDGAAAAGLSGLLMSGGTGSPLTSFVVPSLLFDDLTITKRADELPKPPISAPPGAQR
jgi:predicted Zn-dependent protease